MREILFRGKRLDNGEWVEGNLLGNELILPKGQVVYKTDDNRIVTHEVNCYAIDPSTVGQYTGLTDKNGKRIFEGDIFEWGYAGVKDFRYVIVYDAKLASFVGERHFGFVSLNGIDIEIIGNIHDNPELLEGARDE